MSFVEFRNHAREMASRAAAIPGKGVALPAWRLLQLLDQVDQDEQAARAVAEARNAEIEACERRLADTEGRVEGYLAAEREAADRRVAGATNRVAVDAELAAEQVLAGLGLTPGRLGNAKKLFRSLMAKGEPARAAADVEP
jgi:hypothetical protein